MELGPRGSLVSFENRRGLKLDGIFYKAASPDSDTVLIHVHGSMGNFYHQAIVTSTAASCLRRGISMLSFNTSGHDAVVEWYRTGAYGFGGGALCDWSEAVDDLAAAVDFASQFGSKLVLQGHSLGCDRILQFLTRSGKALPFALLAQCDCYQIQANVRSPETVEEQHDRLTRLEPNHPFELLPPSEYGVRQEHESYPVPISAKALISMMEGTAFELVRLSKPHPFFVPAPAFMYVGGKDSLQTAPSEEMFSYFRPRVSSLNELYCENGDHEMTGLEDFVADQVAEWVAKVAVPWHGSLG